MSLVRTIGLAGLLTVQVAAGMLCLAPPPAHAQVGAIRPAPASEVRVQAAYLLKFPSYVVWPEARRAPSPNGIVVAIAQADDLFEEAVKIAAALPPQLRPVLRKIEADEGLEGVHVLYIGRDADPDRYRKWTAQAAIRSVLVVTSGSRAPHAGSTISFRVVDERLRFDISLYSAEKANLKVTAPLLSLAATVIRDN